LPLGNRIPVSAAFQMRWKTSTLGDFKSQYALCGSTVRRISETDIWPILDLT